jgi:hypothetical protein
MRGFVDGSGVDVPRIPRILSDATTFDGWIVPDQAPA